MATKLTKHKIYEIQWRDHFSTDGFFDQTVAEIEDEIVFHSVGYFIKENKNYWYLARTLGKDSYADMMNILKKNTLSIKELHENTPA
jgi:hypothetical protein